MATETNCVLLTDITLQNAEAGKLRLKFHTARAYAKHVRLHFHTAYSLY